jgi:diguanylate cyclase (GGDEF)-like protein
MKILVLNTDLTERSVIQQVLQRGGHQVIMADTSQEAWEVLRQGAARFLIADRTNTDMDSANFIEQVRSSRLPAHVYILMISARGNDQETLSFPADDYLYKPISTVDLKARVSIGERILSLGDNLMQAKSQLESLALLDPLTNLYNQRAFLSAAAGELERARRSQGPISLIMLDVDNFQGIAGTYGAQVAEDVLAIIGQVIREKSRPYDCIGRWGTDSFASALPNVIGTDAEKIAMRILGSMHSMNVTPPDGTPLKVQMSAGVAMVSHITASMEIDPLIEQARQAMLRARESGGDQVFLSYS